MLGFCFVCMYVQRDNCFERIWVGQETITPYILLQVPQQFMHYSLKKKKVILIVLKLQQALILADLL